MAQRSQRRLRSSEQTLRPRRARREPKRSRRAKRHEPISELPSLQRSPSHPRQYGLVEPLRRFRMPKSSRPVCDLRFRSILRSGCNRLCTGHGSEGIIAATNDTTLSSWWRRFRLLASCIYFSLPFLLGHYYYVRSAAEQSDKAYIYNKNPIASLNIAPLLKIIRTLDEGPDNHQSNAHKTSHFNEPLYYTLSLPFETASIQPPPPPPSSLLIPPSSFLIQQKNRAHIHSLPPPFPHLIFLSYPRYFTFPARLPDTYMLHSFIPFFLSSPL